MAGGSLADDGRSLGPAASVSHGQPAGGGPPHHVRPVPDAWLQTKEGGPSASTPPGRSPSPTRHCAGCLIHRVAERLRNLLATQSESPGPRRLCGRWAGGAPGVALARNPGAGPRGWIEAPPESHSSAPTAGRGAQLSSAERLIAAPLVQVIQTRSPSTPPSSSPQ
jgi:hypothetical protein